MINDGAEASKRLKGLIERGYHGAQNGLSGDAIQPEPACPRGDLNKQTIKKKSYHHTRSGTNVHRQ